MTSNNDLTEEIHERIGIMSELQGYTYNKEVKSLMLIELISLIMKNEEPNQESWEEVKKHVIDLHHTINNLYGAHSWLS